MGAQEQQTRWDAIRALGKIGSQLAAPPLIDALNDINNQVTAAIALGEIGGIKATEALVSVLNDKDETLHYSVAEALAKIVYAGDEKCASIARKRLDSAFKDKDLRFIAGGIEYYIREGKFGSESVLISAFKEHGGKYMAEILLNSDNFWLERAAKQWAQSHGYTIETSGEYGAVRWGNK
jgi:hypothetical protein